MSVHSKPSRRHHSGVHAEAKAEVHERPKAEYITSSGQDEGYHNLYRVGKDEVEIYPPARDSEGFMMPYRVVWEGAVDFEGNRRDLLKRYPEFKGEL